MARKRDEYQFYTTTVEDWEFDYDFSLANSKLYPGPYSEYADIMIQGHIIEPVIKDKSQAELTIMGTSRLDHHYDERYSDHTPRSVGFTESRGEKLTAVISVPLRALAPMVSMLASGKAREVRMIGTRLKWRKALLHSFRISTRTENDD